jgi:hypothetical protein
MHCRTGMAEWGARCGCGHYPVALTRESTQRAHTCVCSGLLTASECSTEIIGVVQLHAGVAEYVWLVEIGDPRDGVEILAWGNTDRCTLG